MNFVDVLIILALITVVTLVIYKKIKDRKNGRSSCSCGCENCAVKDECHQKKKKDA